jgi:hypothetical protein
MLFNSLYDSVLKGELILIDGGFCRWHIRRDGQLTIREIIATRKGAGSEMLEMLKEKSASSIFAKCPSILKSGNDFYKKKGFKLEATEKTNKGKKIYCWRLLSKSKRKMLIDI